MPVYVSCLPRLFGNTSATFFPRLLSCDITTLFVSCKVSLMATYDVVGATPTWGFQIKHLKIVNHSIFFWTVFFAWELEANSELHLNNQDR